MATVLNLCCGSLDINNPCLCFAVTGLPSYYPALVYYLTCMLYGFLKCGLRFTNPVALMFWGLLAVALRS